MLEGAYKPMVITFELINTFVIFQAIINNLFRNLRYSYRITSFINDVLVAVDIEKSYNEIVLDCHISSPIPSITYHT